MKNYDIVEMFLSQEFELRDKSIDNYRRYINRFLNDLSKLVNEIKENNILANINVANITQVFKAYRNVDSKSTYNFKVVANKKFGKYLKSAGLIQNNYFEILKTYKDVEAKKKEVLSIEEINRVIDESYITQTKEVGNKALKGSRIRLFMALATTTGMRKEEILNITMDRLSATYDKNGSFLGYIISFDKDQNKSKVVKGVPVGNKTLKLFNEYIEERNKIVTKDNNYLFINDKGNKRYAKQTCLDTLRRVIGNTNITNKNIVPHSFRKTFRSTLTFNNVNENVIRLIGGWKLDSTTTATYICDDDISKFEVCNIL